MHLGVYVLLELQMSSGVINWNLEALDDGFWALVRAVLPVFGVGVPYGSTEKWKWIGERQERNLSFLGSNVGILVRGKLNTDPGQQTP
ncbi:hypothetical protein Q5P01_019908 [Channa striata]|uniref:Uncharacterized protein n=1 Tax=Channa striata TaxID=64152 RepID=A0AA88M293_CHASR|nr:hypothetical protein Q5P01_019908 [Channa striata]